MKCVVKKWRANICWNTSKRRVRRKKNQSTRKDGAYLQSDRVELVIRTSLDLWVSIGYTGFYWVLLSFTWFPWLKMGFNRLYWILLGFHRFEWVSIGYTGFYFVLLGFHRLKWVSISYTGFYWVSIGLNGFQYILLGFTRFP